MVDKMRQLFAHMKWADGRMLDGLESNERARAIFAHVLGAEHVWLTRLEGRSSTVAVWPVLSAEECATLAAANASAYENFLAHMTEDGLARSTSYTNSAGASFTSRVDDILMQVVTHGSYHRGQVAQLLRADGVTPNATDYIAYVRGLPS